MCGRYIPNTEDEIMEIRDILTEISIRLTSIDHTKLACGFDIYPSKDAPIIYIDNNIGHFELSKFGLKKWGDSTDRIFNARSEGLLESRFFNSLLDVGRCIVPARGYYEWKKVDSKHNEKYCFTKQNSSIDQNKHLPIYMLGIYRKETNEFAIITKSANEICKAIHHRMPVMISKDYISKWLFGNLEIKDINNIVDEDIIFQTMN